MVISKKLPTQGRSTFNWWILYDLDSEIKNINPKDLPANYQSSYLKCWNYITDRGWVKENRMWYSPDKSLKFKTVYEAYRSQKFKEMLEGTVDEIEE